MSTSTVKLQWNQPWIWNNLRNYLENIVDCYKRSCDTSLILYSQSEIFQLIQIIFSMFPELIWYLEGVFYRGFSVQGQQHVG